MIRMRTPYFLHAYVLLILITLISGCSDAVQITVNNGLVIRNAVIISADEQENLQQYIGFVVIDADTIVYRGEEPPTLTGNYDIIEAEGKFVIPGLIDSHVHTGHAIALKDEHYETKPDLVNAYFEQLPKSYLYFGFTTLIDPDLRKRNRDRFERAGVRPDLYDTGRGVRYFNGYGQSLFPEGVRYRIFPTWIYDEAQLEDMPEDMDLSLHSVESVVQQTLDGGGIALKTYYERGFGGVFDWPVPSEALLKKLVEEAHSKELPVLIHATSYDAYEKGLAADVDIFAHGLWHWEGDRLDATPPDGLADLYRTMAQAGKYIQPTMRVIFGEQDTYTWSLLSHPDLKHVLPQIFIDWMQTDDGKWAQQEMMELYRNAKPDPSISDEQYLQSMNERLKKTTKLAHDSGVHLILGSDTPASEGIGNVPGLNGFLEIKALSEAGIDRETIFVASTIRNARAFGLHDRIGSIETGKRANILILNSDPLLDINAYNDIDIVILSGTQHKRARFSAMGNRL